MNLDLFNKRSIPSILLILLVGSIIYANTFQVPFVLDDQATILRDTFVHDLGNFLPGSVDNKLDHPRWLSYLTFALNYHFGGFEATGYHLVNLCIHLTAGLLVFTLLHLTFKAPFFQRHGLESGVGDDGAISQPSSFLPPERFIPLFAALLFVAHPVQTQAVTYIVQRMTSLATMLYLLAVVLYAAARLNTQKGAYFGHEPGKKRRGACPASLLPAALLAGSVLSAILAMKTKEIAFTLPMAVTLYEFCFFKDGWKKRLTFLLPLLMTLPVVPLSVLAMGREMGQNTGSLLADMGQQTLVYGKLSNLDYLFTQFRVIVTYLRLLILPVNQNLDYDFPVYTTFFTPAVSLSFLLLALLFALAVFLFLAFRPGGRRSTHVADPKKPVLCLVSFGMLWFFLTLSVESSLISIADVIVEHRLYLPSFGAVAVFAGLFWLARERFSQRVSGKLFLALAVVLVVASGIGAYKRNQVWGSAVSLWRDVVAKSPGKVRGYNNLGNALTDANRLSEAAEVLTKAIEMDPSHPHAYNNLGLVYLMRGQTRQAIPLFRRAISLDMDFPDAYINLALALNQERRFRETINLLEPNLGFLGERVEAHYHLGVAYVFLGYREAARRKLEIVAKFNSVMAADLIRLLRDVH